MDVPNPLYLRRPDGTRTTLRRTDAPFASGGDAKILALPERPDLAAKCYHDPTAAPERPEKPRAMLDAPPSLKALSHEGQCHTQLAWPPPPC